MPFGKMLLEFRRAKNIVRWQDEFRHRKSDDAQHMWFTSLIALGLARWEEDKFSHSVDYKILAHATILHDVSEVLTGDILSGTKRNTPEMHAAIKTVEVNMFESSFNKLIPHSWLEEYRGYILEPKSFGLEGKILAASDIIDALFECIEEIELGNSRFASKLIDVAEMLINIELDSVRYFLKYSLQDLGLPLSVYGSTVNDFLRSLNFDANY